jgi:hypothetical protein
MREQQQPVVADGLGDYLTQASAALTDMPGPSNDYGTDLPFFPLPPALPQPPARGMVLSRGQWRKAGSVRSHPQKKKNVLRKHHYSPHTISGKMFTSTLDTLNEPEGVHQCPECPNRFPFYEFPFLADKFLGQFFLNIG